MNTPRRFAAVLLALDTVAVLGVFNALAMLRGLLAPGDFFVQPFLIPLAVLIVGLYLIDAYNLRTDMLGVAYASEHTIAVLSVLLVMGVVTFVLLTDFHLLQQSRAVLVAGYVALIPLTLGYRRMLYLRATRDRRDRCFIFVGKQNDFAQFASDYATSQMDRRLVPVLADTPGPYGEPNLPLQERLFAEVEKRRDVLDGIILRESTVELGDDAAERLVALHFGGVPSYTLELFHELFWRKIPLYRLNQVWLFQQGFSVAREPAFERVKRLMDLLAAGLGLLLTAPLFVLVALLVLACDGRPVLFRQSRVGRNRTPFTLFKFRTMHAAAPGAAATADAAPRVTRLGKLLRQTRLDELPQLWNVLGGEMSLIGPRAEWDRLVDDYEQAIPCYHFRHLVRPGITGWAQVNLPYSSGRDDAAQKLEYDLYYIKHFSFRLDATIVLKTIHTMLFGKGR